MRRFLSLLAVLLSAAPLLADGVLIRCQRPCTAAKAAVVSAGGTVSIGYRYVDAIAAEVPHGSISPMSKQLPAASVVKDFMVDEPKIARDRNGSRKVMDLDGAEASALDAAAIAQLATDNPNGYRINNANLNLGPLFAAGFTGNGIKVAVIDTGIRPGFPHISLDGSVIGGEDFVRDGLGYSNFANNGHGTFVAGMISANVTFRFNSLSTFAKSVKFHCPSCVVPAPPGFTGIPMIGSAPLSSIYALRIFAPTGGAPESRVIQAMERVIQLRENYDNGQPETKDAFGKYSALNIKVCNMSLGGSTLYAGRDIEDQITNAFLAHDIVLTTSAGNAGPSSMTGGSPGTGFDTLTVGASSDAIHERIVRDLQFGFGAGVLFRPFGGTQTATFSSRGPTADGRTDPDVVANGDWSFGQGFTASVNNVNFAGGTSFSSPTLAGIAACLRQAVPTATARQVRNAIMMTANPNVLTDGSGPQDQGNGYPNAEAARALLASGGAPNTDGVPGPSKKSVEQNIGMQVFSGNVTRQAVNLRPGQRFETFYRVNADSEKVIVTISGFQGGTVQNAFFGDDIFFTAHSAKTSSIGEGDYKAIAFTTGGTFVLDNLDAGLMRITLNGDWTNASNVSATVTLSTLKFQDGGNHDAKLKILEGDLIALPFTVPKATKKLRVRVEWKDNWSAYPTDDLDLILVAPDGTLNFDGATLNSPEFVNIANPLAGKWVAYVDGFSVATGDEKYNLIITTDDNTVDH